MIWWTFLELLYKKILRSRIVYFQMHTEGNVCNKILLTYPPNAHATVFFVKLACLLLWWWWLKCFFLHNSSIQDLLLILKNTYFLFLLPALNYTHKTDIFSLINKTTKSNNTANPTNDKSLKMWDPKLQDNNYAWNSLSILVLKVIFVLIGCLFYSL